MQTYETNTSNEQVAPELITSVPGFEAPVASAPAETGDMIEVPEEHKASSTERNLASTAINVFHIPVTVEHGPSNGVVVVDKPAPEIIENPGPQALRLAAAQDNSRYTIVGR